MDNVLYWAVLGFTALPIVVGALLGLKRGLNRSLLRLLIVAAAILVAWLMRDSLTETIMNLQMGGQSLKESIEASFTENPEMLKLVMPIVQIAVGVVAFLVTFLLLKLASLIVFWLLCIVVRPGKLKNRLLGLAVGAVQGILVAYFICVPITGLVTSIDKVSEIDFEGINASATVSTSGNEDVSLCGIYAESAFGFNVLKTSADNSPNESDDVSENDQTSAVPEELKPILEVVSAYKKTSLYKIYNGVEFGTYKGLTTVKSEEGRKVTLDVQINAVIALSKIAKNTQQLQKVDFSDGSGLTEEKIDKVKDVFNNIEDVKKELTPEVKESITEIIAVASDALDLPIDASKIDLDKIDFSKAGEALDKAYQLQKSKEEGKVEEVKASEVLEIFNDSNLVIPAAEMGIEVGSMLNDADKQEFKEAIEDLDKNGKIDEETKAALEKIFGVSLGN